MEPLHINTVHDPVHHPLQPLPGAPRALSSTSLPASARMALYKSDIS